MLGIGESPGHGARIDPMNYLRYFYEGPCGLHYLAVSVD